MARPLHPLHTCNRAQQPAYRAQHHTIIIARQQAQQHTSAALTRAFDLQTLLAACCRHVSLELDGAVIAPCSHSDVDNVEE